MRHASFAVSALAMLAASACTAVEPVMLASGFEPKYGRFPWSHALDGAAPPACKVSIGEVIDARSDTQSMGRFGGRYVRHDDTVGWLRSGLETLSHDKRLQFVGAEGGDSLVLHVSLLKAYMEGLATSKNATVVLRVRYAHGGATVSENTYRGDLTDVNWGSGDGEARDSLNIALQEALHAVDADLAGRCSKLLEPQVLAAG